MKTQDNAAERGGEVPAQSTEVHRAVDTRYRDFRNFMCNELGITRQDIKAWTMEAVSNEVTKLLGQMNLEERARVAIDRVAREAVGIQNWNTNGDKLRQAVAMELVKQLKLSSTSA